MTREIAEMWADILVASASASADGWSVVARNYRGDPVLLSTAKECFDWAVTDAIDRAVDDRLRAIEERLP